MLEVVMVIRYRNAVWSKWWPLEWRLPTWAGRWRGLGMARPAAGLVIFVGDVVVECVVSGVGVGVLLGLARAASVLLVGAERVGLGQVPLREGD